MFNILVKEDKPEDQVRHSISKLGGAISEKIDLYDFWETGRGVIANKQVYNFEKIIHIPHKLVVTAPFILEQCPGIQLYKPQIYYSNVQCRVLTGNIGTSPVIQLTD